MSFRKKRIALIRLSAVPVVLLAVFVRPEWRPNATVAYCIESAGFLLLVAGLGIRLWSILYIGGRKSRELVTDGPYSLCRNPLYIGTLLLVIGAGLCFENVLMLAAALLVMIPVHLVTTRMEERHLLELFPDTYPDYARRVPRFWPRLRGYRNSETVVVRVHALRRMATDGILILMIPVIEDFLEVLHMHDVVPVLLHFP